MQINATCAAETGRSDHGQQREMSLNVEGGLSRIVRALRALGKVWWWGILIVFALYLGLSGERDVQAVSALVAAGLVVAAIPAGCALGLAWLLAGFLEPKK